MVRFIIIRHGCSLGNREKRFSGQEDFPLTEEGVAQARVTARYVLDHFRVDKIYASDLGRAMDRIARENDGKTVVVGAHGGVIRNLYSVWKPLPLARIKESPPIPNGSVTEVEYEQGNYRILRFADGSHLDEYTKE